MSVDHPCASRTLLRRQCCPAAKFEFLEPPGTVRSSAYRFSAGDAPIIGEIAEPQPCERTSFHEAGHAAIGHALGLDIEHVTAREPARVTFVATGDLGPSETVAKLYGGPVGEMVRSRHWSTIPPSEEADYLERVAAFRFGGCDECRMAMTAWAAVGFDAGIDAARAVFRDGQLLALRLTQERRIQQAIRALATDLMERPTCSGKRAHSILEPFVKFGEFKKC